MSQREQFEFLHLDAAMRSAVASGLVEIMPSLEMERTLMLRLTDRGLEIFRSLDLGSQSAMALKTG